MTDPKPRLDDARLRVTEISAEALMEALDDPTRAPMIIDVREEHEVALGKIPGATTIPRGRLELDLPEAAPDRSRPVVTVCAGGTRSLLAAETMMGLGYGQVASLRGGMEAWVEAKGGTEHDDDLRPDQRARYQRHLALPEIGAAGQAKLLRSRVLCVGAGGLGSPAALYLAAAGVGTLGIADPDAVESSNLQRQVLHRTERVGMAKVASAKLTLRALNPDVDVVRHQVRVDTDNIFELAKGYDVIVDGSDNFATRDVLNACFVATGIPVVHAAIHRFEGQITSFVAGGPCYRCLFPTSPPATAAPNCATAGVLGVLPGLLGTLQATETIKILLGVGDTLVGRLFIFDALGVETSTVRYARAPSCRVCGTGRAAP